MNFRIADTFTDSLAKLTGAERKAAKIKAFDLQLNPASPGMSFHKLDKAKDKNFWSIRVSNDLRMIVHKTFEGMLLCYVDHHDTAYQWAARRKLETHPKTGAAQLIEIRETVQERTVPRYVEQEQPVRPKPPLFANIPADDLLGYGVPEEWLGDVRAADEDSFLDIVGHLPGEAAEALLELATGAIPQVQAPVAAGTDPFAHPDAQRRFRVMSNVAELEQALEYPWEKWLIFTHPLTNSYNKMKNFYEILELTKDVEHEKIKEKYRLMLHAWHPDKFPEINQKKIAEEKTKEINEAYNTLSNKIKRARYDIEMSWNRQNIDEKETARSKRSRTSQNLVIGMHYSLPELNEIFNFDYKMHAGIKKEASGNIFCFSNTRSETYSNYAIEGVYYFQGQNTGTKEQELIYGNKDLYECYNDKTIKIFLFKDYYYNGEFTIASKPFRKQGKWFFPLVKK